MKCKIFLHFLWIKGRVTNSWNNYIYLLRDYVRELLWCHCKFLLPVQQEQRLFTIKRKRTQSKFIEILNSIIFIIFRK
jgi:hypothetical protein